MSTLAVKLSTLVVKQLSKPFANSLASVLLSNETLRKGTVAAARVRCYLLASLLQCVCVHLKHLLLLAFLNVLSCEDPYAPFITLH